MALKIGPKPKFPPNIVTTSDQPIKTKSLLSNNGSLSEILASIRKNKGEKVIIPGNKIPVVRRLPTGIFEFDFYIGGGFPCGRYSIVYGPECLAADTHIQYEVRDQYGKRQNHKGGTIEKLWHRFHGKVMPGKGHYQRKKTQYSEFTAACMNSEGRIFQNTIVDVVNSGLKICYQLTTESGLQLSATASHQFYIGNGYKSLSDLTVGDTIFVHKNVPFTGRMEQAQSRQLDYVKHHPYGALVVKEGKYVYKALYRSRLVVEALNNQMSLTEYVNCLNAGKLEGLVFLSPELDVHHKNEDVQDDSPDNLEVLSSMAHGRYHALQRHNNLRYQVMPEKIVNIVAVGMKHTFDISMAVPYNNYIANGLVVHNSSCKTNICLKAVSQAQKQAESCNKAVWVDVEHSFDPIWAERMGVDTKKLLVVDAGYGEEAVDLVDALVRAEDVAIIVVDSMAALIASREIAQSTEKYDIGTSALLIKRMVNKLMIAFGEERKRDHDPCVILINQTRFKPGVMFGDPETMPGGEAQKFLSSLRVRLSAKNEIDKATSTLIFKETKAIIKKAKIPVRAADFTFKLCVHDHDDLKAGETDSFNMVKSHLQALGLLVKAPQGYVIKTAEIMLAPTLTVIADRYQKDEAFRMKMQALVIENYQDSLIFVEETDYSPKDVSPGTVQPIAEEKVEES